MSSATSEEFNRLRQRINARLEALLPACLSGQALLADAIRGSVLAPGKRLRPMLSALTAIDLEGDIEAAIDGGCAIELVHTASLVLDDLPSMDNATLRRGQLPTHLAFGEDTALLAVIAMVSKAFEIVAACPTLDHEQRTRCVATLGRAVGTNGLVAGQFADLHGGREARSTDDIATANALKTSSLFTAAIEIGMTGSDATPEARRELHAFAGELGLAFQLLDDLLDDGPNAGAIGKDVGQDAGKSTIVSMIGRASAEDQIDRHMRNGLKHLETVFAANSRLSALLHAIWETARTESTLYRARFAGPRVDEPAGMQ